MWSGPRKLDSNRLLPGVMLILQLRGHCSPIHEGPSDSVYISCEQSQAAITLQAFHIFQLNIFLNLQQILFSLLTHYTNSCIPSPFCLWIQRLLSLQTESCQGLEMFSPHWSAQFPWQGRRETQVERTVFILKMSKVQKGSDLHKVPVRE